MTADVDVENTLNGVQGDGQTALPWRGVYLRARTVLSTYLNRIPFSWPSGTSPQSTSTYDQVQVTAEQVGWRYIDRYGNVWDHFGANVVLIEWLLDGAPTPLTLAKIAQYRANAGTLNPWPTGFPGAFAGEPQQTYPTFPPVTPAPTPAL